MKPDESLLICCKSFQEACENRYANITVRKIPKMLLGRCEFGKEDYSLNIVNLPEPTPSLSQEENLEKDISKEGKEHTTNSLSRGKCKSPLLGGDSGVGKSDKRKKSEKDNNSKSYNKQRKPFE